jgi:hypothetical protein
MYMYRSQALFFETHGRRSPRHRCKRILFRAAQATSEKNSDVMRPRDRVAFVASLSARASFPLTTTSVLPHSSSTPLPPFSSDLHEYTGGLPPTTRMQILPAFAAMIRMDSEPDCNRSTSPVRDSCIYASLSALLKLSSPICVHLSIRASAHCRRRPPGSV